MPRPQARRRPQPRRPRRPQKLPLSGSEETFTNKRFGSPRGVRNNNCYAWAIGHYDGSGGVKLQPGDLAGVRSRMSLASCTDLKKRALLDSRAPGQKQMYATRPLQPCQKGYYKVMAFLDPSTDYHWYRQHKDVWYRMQAGNSSTSVAKKLGVPLRKVRRAPGGMALVQNAGVWSHKQGFAGGPKLEDACGKMITDPRKACRDYGEYDYERFCGSYCVRSTTALKPALKSATALKKSPTALKSRPR